MKQEAETITVQYNLDEPKLNLSVPPEKVPPGQYWKLNGVDGRFIGGHRRFPGFNKLSYTVMTDSVSRTTDKTSLITGSSAYYLFKYVVVQKEDQDEVLRGWLIGVDAESGTSGLMDLIYLHHDTENGKWYTYVVDTDITNTTKVDAASVGRNLVVAVSGQTPWSVKWKYDPDPSGSADGLVKLKMGPGDETGGGSAADITSDGTSPQSSGFLKHTKTYRVRYRWYDSRRNLWSKLSEEFVFTATSWDNVAFKLKITKADVTDRAENDASDGYNGFTKLYIYRSIDGGGALYLEQIVNFSEYAADAGQGTDGVAKHDDRMVGTTAVTTVYEVRVGGRAESLSGSIDIHKPTMPTAPLWSAGMNDDALILQRLYDPFMDEDGDPPQSGLIASYQEGAFMQGKAVSDKADTTGTIRWSTLYHPSAENFPETEHFYRPSNVGHTVLTLHDGGDYAYAVRDDVIVRLHRSVRMAVNELMRKIGGTGRYGSTTVGQFLYVVTPIGLLSVDGTSGRQDVVASMERVFIDSEKWGKDLSDIHLVFDGHGAALFVLNGITEEMYVLWFGNGAVTALVDCPFAYATRGPDPESGGPGLAWFLGPGGNIFSVNWKRTGDSQTMFGAGKDQVVNTSVASSVGTIAGTKNVTRTSLTLTAVTGGTLPYEDLVGFWMYFLGGPNRGVKRKVLVASSTHLEVSNLPYTFTLDGTDTVSLGPVALEVGLPIPRRAREVDMFVRKGLQGGMCSLKMWGQEVNQEVNPNLQVIYGVRDAKHSVINEGEGLVNEEPVRTAGRVVFKGNVPLPEVRQLASNVDLELQGVQFYGTIEATDADEKP